MTLTLRYGRAVAEVQQLAFPSWVVLAKLWSVVESRVPCSLESWR